MLGPNLHLSYEFSISPEELGKSLCFILIFRLMLLKLNHIFFAFHIISLFQALILCVLFNLDLRITKLIQKMAEIFVIYPLLVKLKISSPLGR
jgi:hypothetical protein